MYFINAYLCEHCLSGQSIKDDKIIKERICETCKNPLHYSRSFEFDDNGQKIREYISNGRIVEYNKNNTPKKPTPQTPPKPTITCPYCQSTDCKKISGVSRWASTGLFGLASGKLSKQWHCNSCKSDF